MVSDKRQISLYIRSGLIEAHQAIGSNISAICDSALELTLKKPEEVSTEQKSIINGLNKIAKRIIDDKAIRADAVNCRKAIASNPALSNRYIDAFCEKWGLERAAATKMVGI